MMLMLTTMMVMRFRRQHLTRAYEKQPPLASPNQIHSLKPNRIVANLVLVLLGVRQNTLLPWRFEASFLCVFSPEIFFLKIFDRTKKVSKTKE